MAMYVALGFCIAGLLAIAALPAVWRRAVRLTRRAVEATTPMTHAEVRAEIGALRAAHAVEYRRLEAGVERLQRSAAENRIARDRAESVASDLRKEFAAREQALSESVAREDVLRRDLAEREEALARARVRVRELERTVQRLASRSAGEAGPETSEVDAPAARAGTGTTAETSSVDRGADLAAITRLESEVATLRRQLEKARRERDTRASDRPAQRVADEIVQLRKDLRERDDRLFAAETSLVTARAEIARLSILAEDGTARDGEAADTGASDRVGRMAARVSRLEADNARLRADLHANEDLRALRDELSDLAAGIVTGLASEEDLAGLEDAGNGPAPEEPAAGGAAPAIPVARPPDDAPSSERAQSLAARIRAARGRMKADAKSRATGTDGPTSG